MSSFEALRRSIPSIHVCHPANGPTNLVAHRDDADRSTMHFLDSCVVGNGRESDPYRLGGACGHSSHRVIVCMWFELQPALRGGPDEYFIEVGGCLLRVNARGVIAADGQATDFVRSESAPAVSLLDEFLASRGNPSSDPAKLILFAIMCNLTGRSGLDDAWDGIDTSIKEEILAETIAVVRGLLPS